MRKVFIPTIGTVLKLARDWMPRIYLEHRNMKLLTSVFPDKEEYKNHWYGGDAEFISSICFPKGTTLKMSRIYVRQGASDYDSVTYTVVKSPRKDLKGRFWVKLADANEMECDDENME